MSFDLSGAGLAASVIKPRLFLLGSPGAKRQKLLEERAREVRALHQEVDVVPCLTLSAIRDAQLGALREEFALPGEAWLVRYSRVVTRERLSRDWIHGGDLLVVASPSRAGGAER